MHDPRLPPDPPPARKLNLPNGWGWYVLAAVLLLWLLWGVTGCRPAPRPPAADSVAVDTMAVDTAPVVSAAAESLATDPALIDTTEQSVPELTPADTLVGLGPQRRGLPSSAGLPLGMGGYPTSQWCTGYLSGTIVSGNPDLILGVIRAAERCHVRIAITFPRKYMTVNGEADGAFSPTKARAFVDRLARVLPPDTLTRYRRTILYLSGLDDMGCAACWGGHAITQAQTAAHLQYAQQRLGTAPIGLRVGTDWMARDRTVNWNHAVDVSVNQWHKKKGRGDQLAWYTANRNLMSRVGVTRMIYAVNVEDCGGTDTPPCTATELRQYLTNALTFDPAHNCGAINWRYDAARLRQAGYTAVWQAMATLARGRTGVVTCAAGDVSLGGSRESVLAATPSRTAIRRSGVVKVTVQPHTASLVGTTARATLQGHARDAGGPKPGTVWAWTVRDATILAPITSTKSAVTLVPTKNGGTYVVATAWATSDSALISVSGINPIPPGIAINPGDNFQAKVDANPTGTVFTVKTGTHRFATVNPKASDQFYGEAGAVMTGARDLSAGPWTASGSTWWVGGQTQQNTDYNTNYSCLAGHDGCFYPEQLFVNDTLYEHMTTLAGVTAGSQKWFFDYAADRIYLGRNPAGQTIETSVTPYAFGGTAANVVVKHLTIRRYANAAQKGAINYGAATGWRIDTNTVEWTHGAGFRLVSGKAYGNALLHNGQLGYSCGGTNTVIEGNEIAYNNTAFFGSGPFGEFGSGKCAFTTNLVFRNNDVHNNIGPGPWTDINNTGCLIEGNTVDSNTYRGIFHEISQDCVIRNNTVRWNGLQNPMTSVNAADRGGIVISDSRNVEVYGNTLVGNQNGITCIDAVRNQWPTTLSHDPEDLSIHDNTVTQFGGRAGGCSDSDAGHDPYAAGSNNVWGPNNHYTLNSSTRFRWSPNVDITWAQWRTAGQDVGSTQVGQ